MTADQQGADREEQPEPLWREIVGQEIRGERAAQQLTLDQVAQRAGISPQYLSEVERGLKDSSSEMLSFICGALRIRLADLLLRGRERLAASSRPLAVVLPLSGPSDLPIAAARPQSARPGGRITGPVLSAA